MTETPAVSVRLASADDVPRVYQIERASFSDPWTRGSFSSLVGNPLVHFAVADAPVDSDAPGLDGCVVGYVVVWLVVDDAEIANVAVAPEARGRGVGALLLDDALRAARQRGVRAVYLEVRESNAAARALYRSRGFAEVGRRRRYYRRPVEDALVMRRALGEGGS